MKLIIFGFAILALVSTSAIASSCPTLTIAPKAFPHAVVGKEYRETASFFGGEAPITLTLTAGVLPPGINLLATGEISGVPKASGRYGFTIRASDSCRPLEQSAIREITLIVQEPGKSKSPSDTSITRKPSLKISVSPEPRQMEIAKETRTSSLHYRLSATPAETATIDSPGASFLVNGSVVTSVSAPLTAVLVNGVSDLNETIAIPQKVIEQTIRENAGKFIYNRPFIGRGSTALAVIEFRITK